MTRARRTGGALSDCTPSSPVLQRVRAGAGLRRDRHVAATAGRPSAYRGRPAGPGGAGRLLDVLVHQLPAVAAPRGGVERGLRKDGLTVVGVHTPEFAFEHDVGNITRAAAQLGVHYPIAVDNAYATWDNYQNSYWPAEYLIDATGTVRHVDFGEGGYAQTETFIRQLLRAARPGRGPAAPHRRARPDAPGADHPGELPRLPLQRGEPVRGERHAGRHERPTRRPAACPRTPSPSAARGTSGPRARWPAPARPCRSTSRPRTSTWCSAERARWRSRWTGPRPAPWSVAGVPRLYQLVGPGAYGRGTADPASRPGVEAYDFTFG